MIKNTAKKRRKFGQLSKPESIREAELSALD
jgi:hypothetical protein